MRSGDPDRWIAAHGRDEQRTAPSPMSPFPPPLAVRRPEASSSQNVMAGQKDRLSGVPVCFFAPRSVEMAAEPAGNFTSAPSCQAGGGVAPPRRGPGFRAPRLTGMASSVAPSRNTPPGASRVAGRVLGRRDMVRPCMRALARLRRPSARPFLGPWRPGRRHRPPGAAWPTRGPGLVLPRMRGGREPRGAV